MMSAAKLPIRCEVSISPSIGAIESEIDEFIGNFQDFQRDQLRKMQERMKNQNSATRQTGPQSDRGAVAPQRIGEEIIYKSDELHEIAANHIFAKGSRQYASILRARVLDESLRRLQRWFRQCNATRGPRLHLRRWGVALRFARASLLYKLRRARATIAANQRYSLWLQKLLAEDALVRAQALVRRVLALRRVRALKIVAWHRSLCLRRQERECFAATVLQKWFRRFAAKRWRFLLQTFAQERYRVLTEALGTARYSLRRKVVMRGALLRVHYCALKIQRVWRCHSARVHESLMRSVQKNRGEKRNSYVYT
jgi:hypothetical protein